MPKYTIPTMEEIRDRFIDPRRSMLTEQEYLKIKEKSKEIQNKYAFCIYDRQGFMSALRLHILGTTNKKIEDLVDFSKMPHDEFMGYVNGFFDMMDDTKPGRSKFRMELHVPPLLPEEFRQGMRNLKDP